MKNTIQAILGDNGVSLNYCQKTLLSSAADAIKMLGACDLSPASLLSIQVNLEVLWKVEEQKKKLRKEILLAGKPFAAEVKLPMTVLANTKKESLRYLFLVSFVERSQYRIDSGLVTLS